MDMSYPSEPNNRSAREDLTFVRAEVQRLEKLIFTAILKPIRIFLTSLAIPSLVYLDDI